MNPTLERYRQLSYPGRPYLFTHPARLSGLSALIGGPVPPVENARILELGCGDGVNLISLAAHIPGVTALGVDGAPGAIETAQEIAAATGVTSVEFVTADMSDFHYEDAFDYVIAHGVYSWVSADIREALMKTISRTLAPDGLAYISYNITPGWHLRRVVRDSMLFMTAPDDEPRHQVKTAARFAHDMAELLPENVMHGRVFKAYAESAALSDAPFVFHDYLAPENNPVSFQDFNEQCARHGLTWLMESAASDVRHPDLTDNLRLLIQHESSAMTRETLIDHAYGRDFRRSLVVHTKSSCARIEPNADALEPLHVALRAPAPDTIDIREDVPLELVAGRDKQTFVRTHTKGVVALLGACFPASRPFSSLPLLIGYLCDAYATEPIDREVMADIILSLAESEALDILSEPRREPTPCYSHPRAYRLAAHELRRGREQLTNRLHMSVSLDDLDRLILLLSDGRARQDIVDRAVEAILKREIDLLDDDILANPSETLKTKLMSLVHKRIDRLGQIGLMEDDPNAHQETEE
ncbi:MAG: methyltransferase domain-containing protein [Myxococcota bacterium]|nr:methyltransferase domain-containing protein [Myxococcota bacterium]